MKKVKPSKKSGKIGNPSSSNSGAAFFGDFFVGVSRSLVDLSPDVFLLRDWGDGGERGITGDRLGLGMVLRSSVRAEGGSKRKAE